MHGTKRQEVFEVKVKGEVKTGGEEVREFRMSFYKDADSCMRPSQMKSPEQADVAGLFLNLTSFDQIHQLLWTF